MVLFSPGDVVYVHIPRLVIPNTKLKLAPKYHGPCTILKMTTPVTASLRRHADGKVLPKSVHISRLKLGHIADFSTFSTDVVFREEDLPCTIEVLSKNTPVMPKAQKIVCTKVRRAPPRAATRVQPVRAARAT